ncbi:uncharacterized protein LOC129717331 [Wyeomyia smithii]|uniref:uncharacterized protein LOC129717331 n=1 Tax=Wyeomyia smithii TaxID=174621 RepID=UPI0024681B29|nr:uncharacterized protein LOC129717331 [Wyeomyia smithii]
MAESRSSSCIMCQEIDTTDMVQCDVCDQWAHFSCAGVTRKIKDYPWSCLKCSNSLQVPLQKKGAAAGGAKKTSTEGRKSSRCESGSVSSAGATFEESLDKLKEEMEATEKAMENERILRTKRLEMERMLKEKQLRMEREFRELELQQEQDLQAYQLQQEQHILDQRLEREKEFLERRFRMRGKFDTAKIRLEQNYADAIGEERDEDVGGGSVAGSDEIFSQKVEQWLGAQRSVRCLDNRRLLNSTAALSEPIITNRRITGNETGLRGGRLQDFNRVSNQHQQGYGEQNDHDNDLVRLSAEERMALTDFRMGRMRRETVLEPAGLSQAQIAARQSVAKQLPVFRGEAELWPIFISSYEYTTQACGFSNLDNLKRLQDCLRRDALEAVRSRLVLPDSVPDVIRDLQNLFGKPEKLLKTLLVKVRQAKAPRADRLETFLHFGITVKQLCDHLEAAKLVDHLNNPMLVQELVEKLPPNYKLEWVRFKRNKTGTPLRVFTEFMNGIVSDVSEVSEFSASDLTDRNERFDKSRSNKREFVHVHNSSSSKGEKVFTTKNETPSVKNEKPCWVCRRTDHKIRFCEDFRKLNVAERVKIVEKYKLCELCLNNHGKSRCNFKIRCNLAGCQGNHHPLLHSCEEAVQIMEAHCNAHNRLNRSIIFRMLPVTLLFGNRKIDILAFLDEGSSITLVENAIVDKLKVAGVVEPLVVTWTGNMKRYENDSRRVNLMVSARGSAEKFLLREARTVGELILPKQEIHFNEISARYPHLKGLPVADYCKEEPKMMIGLDNMHVFAPLESKVGQPGEPIGVRSKLGWTVYGPEKRLSLTGALVNFHSVGAATNQELHDMIRQQYMLEETGVTPAGMPESAEDCRARELLKATTIRVGDRFETGLLWRDEDIVFPDSYPMAIKRMEALERKLSKNAQLRDKVIRQIEEYQAKGYAHKLTEEELTRTHSSAVWYLPLNVVVNQKKTGKIRLVWDAAASVNGVSLNSQLLKGPDLLTSLVAVLQRFRQRSVGFGGDIKEMFHQYLIRAQDKQAQRFVFRSSRSEAPQKFVMDVGTFGATCSPCSAQYIKNLNAEQFADQYPEAVRAIVDNHYVDDYFDSVDTVEEAVRLAKEVKMIHSRGGFVIRNWVSNSISFLRQMGERSNKDAVHFNKDKETGTERVLGIIWEPTQDVFSFSTTPREELVAALNGTEAPTKRMVLSCVMAMFDPLGLLSPFTVLGKMLVQDLWRTGCGWDDKIETECLVTWTHWIKLFPINADLRISRSYFGRAQSHQVQDLQLHIFTDAGEKAYGCVAYFRAIIDEEKICTLVMSRTKVAPLKQLSVPRLELQAAVLGARLMRTVQENHSFNIQRTYLWTDSQTVLSWIKSDQRKYKQFVGFRIGEILNSTKLIDWRWTPTRSNEADRLTKWRRDVELKSESNWFMGPSFLYEDEEKWPQQCQPATTREELRAQFLFHDIVLEDSLVDVNRFSKWNILVRTMACVLRFVSNCRRQMQGLPVETLKATKKQAQIILPAKYPIIRSPLKQKEFQQAECHLLRACQAEVFGDELKTLIKNRNRPVNEWVALEKSSPLYKLTPLIDENDIIRMEGRTEKAEFWPFDLRFPIILPKEHRVTKLIVLHYHVRFGHGYRETVKNEIRQRFHIPKVGSVVQKVSKECQGCKFRWH